MDRIVVGYAFIFIYGIFGIFTSCFAETPLESGTKAAGLSTPIIDAAATPNTSTPSGDAGANAAKKTLEEVNRASKGDDGTITTITSEMVPGADCSCITGGTIGTLGVSCTGPVNERKYQCTTTKGLSGFQSVFAQIIRYVINISLLLSVLAVVGLGIVWSFAGGDDVKMKSTLKTWAINIIIGLMILFMFRYILMFLAPWIYL